MMHRSLPYDGITRTGSKGLSQLHLLRRGTPNKTAQITGIEDFKQDSPALEGGAKQFVPDIFSNID